MSPPDMDGIARIKGPNKGKKFLTETELIDDYADNKRHKPKARIKGIDMLPDRWRAISLAHGNYLD